MIGYGYTPYGFGPYGGAKGDLAIARLFSANLNTVVVFFSSDLEPDPDSTTFNPANYVIPGLTVIRVLPDPLPYAVRLIVTPQEYLSYELTVYDLRSIYGNALSNAGRTRRFTGWPLQPKLTARAISSRTVQVLFAQPMASSSELVDPAFYVLRDDEGTQVPISSIVPNSNSGALRVRLNLGVSLASGKTYRLQVFEGLPSQEGITLPQTYTSVIWLQPKTLVSVPLSTFTGEVRSPPHLNRNLIENFNLYETLSVFIEPSKDQGNPEPLFSDTFENSGPGSESLDILQLTGGVGPGTPVTTPGDTFTQSIRLQTRLQPFDPSHPNYVSTYSFSLGETLEVDYASADDLVHEHAVAADEKLTIDEFLDVSRPLVYMGVESIQLSESLRVLPEVHSGLDESTSTLFGMPNGQVFFSPALLPSVSTPSTISVDDVKVCTRAYDVYKPPPDLDPTALYTYGGTTAPSSMLSPGFVLFTNFARLTGMKTNVTSKPQDRVARLVDVGASMVLTQIYDPARFSLLSNTGWHLFNNSGLSFVVADNLSPVGSPVVSGRRQFLNPAEDLFFSENALFSVSHLVSVSDSLTLLEDTHRFPGFNQIVTPVSQTLTLGEGLTVVP